MQFGGMIADNIGHYILTTHSFISSPTLAAGKQSYINEHATI